MLRTILLLIPLIQAAPVTVVNVEDPEPTPVTYYGKVLPTDQNGRLVYPRVTEKGLPYPLDYVLKNPEVFPTDSDGKPLPFKEGDPPIPTDESGNFVLPDGTANEDDGELFDQEIDGTFYGRNIEDLPTDEITCGCNWTNADTSHLIMESY